MQELRFVLIIVGALAIAALLFHGLWSSKKEGKAKFGDKPIGKLEGDEADDEIVSKRGFAPTEQEESVGEAKRVEPSFDFDTEPTTSDPLIDGVISEPRVISRREPEITAEPVINNETEEKQAEVDFSAHDSGLNPQSAPATELSLNPEPVVDSEPSATLEQHDADQNEVVAAEPKQEEALDVVVLSVHCSGDEPFVGTQLFDSMQNNGLIYGEMDIFHRHADLSGNGKILFSVANMMAPGTLRHDDPADFTTKGISFFMTLPCYGEADQNFKVMLKTAQQIACDLGGNVLDDQRNMVTPDRLDQYRRQINEFMAKA